LPIRGFIFYIKLESLCILKKKRKKFLNRNSAKEVLFALLKGAISVVKTYQIFKNRSRKKTMKNIL